MKSRISSKYGLDSSPRLVDIIAAVPQEAKKILLPKLRAKPIRTASGVCKNELFVDLKVILLIFMILDCCCGCNV